MGAVANSVCLCGDVQRRPDLERAGSASQDICAIFQAPLICLVIDYSAVKIRSIAGCGMDKGSAVLLVLGISPEIPLENVLL